MQNGLKEKQKKQKLKQLEAEIKDMKRDHKETFAAMYYPSLSYVKPTRLQVLSAVIGTVLLTAAVVWLYFNPPAFERLALFRIGSLRFSRSIFFIPLLISMLFVIFGSRKKAVLYSFIPDAAAAIVGTAVTMNTELLTYPIWLYIIMYSLIFIGAALIFGAYLRFGIHRENALAKIENPDK